MKSIWIAGLAIFIGFAGVLSGCSSTHGSVRVDSASVVIGNKDAQVRVVFNDNDTRTIRDYYKHKGKKGKGKHGKKKGLPPGLAKRETLPPGLQKRIERGQPLPPGLQARLLPNQLEGRLSPLPSLRCGTGNPWQ